MTDTVNALARCFVRVLPTLLLVAGTLGAQPPRSVRLPGFPASIALDSGLVDTRLPAPASAVFHAARQVLFELGIPTPMTDSTRGYLVNPRLVRLRSLAGSPLSRFLDCGTGITGPNADSFRVILAFAALVDSVGPSSTRIRLTVLAGAESTEGVAKTAVACASSGALEERILTAVRARARR